MSAICKVLLDGCSDSMDCIFPNVLRNAGDAYELLASTNLRPLKLFYVHNVVQKLVALIFTFSHIKRFLNFTGTERCNEFGNAVGKRLPAVELGERIKHQIEESLRIDSELIVDGSKTQITQKVHSMEKHIGRAGEEQVNKVGILIVCVGFVLNEIPSQGQQFKRFLEEIKAPLSNKSVTHDYHPTHDGELINFN